MESEIIVAALALAGSLCGTYCANRRSSALIAYRLEQLEKKVEKHNGVMERTLILEEQCKAVRQRLEDHLGHSE